jgi:putative acetyltransferase
MIIKVDDLRGSEIAKLLQAHLDHMYSVSPAASVHALDIEALRHPDITFWSAWEGADLCGCGALKRLSATHVELKSMRTAVAYLRQGVATQLLDHLVMEAKNKGYRALYLETGSQAAFIPARTLYAKRGFERCEPFQGYTYDANSVFMHLDLSIHKI